MMILNSFGNLLRKPRGTLKVIKETLDSKKEAKIIYRNFKVVSHSHHVLFSCMKFQSFVINP